MKKYTSFFLLLVFLSPLVNAQMDVVDPPGTLKVERNFYIDRTPVSNLLFSEFLAYKEIMEEENLENIEEYLAYRENSKQNLKIPSQYLKSYDTNELLRDKEYYQELKYLNHPILTLTKEEARELCEWRTQITRYLWLHDTENLYKVQVANRINYRLPTLKELVQANTFFDKNDTYTYHNNSRVWKTRPSPDDYRYTLFSIYEMTDGEEVFKAHLKEDKQYDFTGFRCVCELKD